jgi:hypothetical protein
MRPHRFPARWYTHQLLVLYPPPAPSLFSSPSPQTDTADYTSVTKTVQLTVNQATSGITWNTPASIVYGTALSSLQLDATSSNPGTLVYTPAVCTILPVGTNTLSVTFTPTDTTNHSSARPRLYS